jgi:hypothetical protein
MDMHMLTLKTSSMYLATCSYLNGNQFQGSIPSEILTANLWEVSLANNRLSGNIPSTFGNLKGASLV